MNSAIIIVIILLALIFIKTFIVVFMPIQWFLGIVVVLGVFVWYKLRKMRM
jgi:hypothetical protein